MLHTVGMFTHCYTLNSPSQQVRAFPPRDFLRPGIWFSRGFECLYETRWLKCLTGSPSCSSVYDCACYTEAVRASLWGEQKYSGHDTVCVEGVCVYACVRHPHAHSLKLVCWLFLPSCSTKCHCGRTRKAQWTFLQSFHWSKEVVMIQKSLILKCFNIAHTSVSEISLKCQIYLFDFLFIYF